MNYKIADLAGKSIEEVGQIIAAAVDLRSRKKEEVDSKMNVITAEVIAIGTSIIYVQDNKPNTGIVRGFNISIMQGGFKPSHASKYVNEYLVEYPNRCSSYIPMSDVYLTRADAARALFGVDSES